MPTTEEMLRANHIAKAVDSMDTTKILVEVTPAQAVCLVWLLQSAVLNPANRGKGQAVGRLVAETLIGAFPPHAREALDYGWKSEPAQPVV